MRELEIYIPEDYAESLDDNRNYEVTNSNIEYFNKLVENSMAEHYGINAILALGNLKLSGEPGMYLRKLG